MTSRKKYLHIKQIFETYANAENAISMAKYMRNQFVFYGIPTPRRKACCRGFLKAEKKNVSIDWDFLDLCYADDHREFQYFACDYLAAFQKILTFEDISQIRRYVRQKQWWDTIDCLDRIIGGIGLEDPRVDGVMLEWSLDEDFWVRRVAIDHQLCRKERTNTALLEQIIVNNLGSGEFFINKAIGWSLRDYSKTNPAWVRDFLNRYGERMERLSVREAGKYV